MMKPTHLAPPGYTAVHDHQYGLPALVGNDCESGTVGFGDVTSDDDILAVLAYIKSTWPEEIATRHDTMNAQ